MTFTVLLYLAIVVAALVLFATEAFAIEVSAMLVLVLLVVSGILSSREAFANFGNEALILIGALFVLSGGLIRTGIVRQAEELLVRLGKDNQRACFSIMLLFVGAVSAFISNTATIAIMVPLVIGLAQRFGDSERKWLLPMAFVAMLGGTNSLIGTSTNILISGQLPHYGIERFGLFTTTWVGLPLLVVGFCYVRWIAPLVLARSSSVEEPQQIDLKYDLRSYTADVVILASSPLVDSAIGDVDLFAENDITVLRVSRSGRKTGFAHSWLVLRTGDTLTVEGNIVKLRELMDRYGLKFREEIKNKAKAAKPGGSESAEASYSVSQPDDEPIELFEVLVGNNSRLRYRTPAQSALRRRYAISVVAINRQGGTIREQVKDVPVLAGDILVVHFPKSMDNRTLNFLGLVPLHMLQHEVFRTKRAKTAAAIFAASLLIGSLTELSFAVSCLAGALAMVLTGVLTTDDIYEFVEWRVLLFIGAVLALGRGMEASGSDEVLAALITTWSTGSPTLALVLFFAATVLLTQPLSNQAAAILLLPLAVRSAHTMGVDPLPLIMTVTIAASCSFLTPMEPGLLLIYGPGRYRFVDFIKVGLPLTLLSGLIGVAVISRVWAF